MKTELGRLLVGARFFAPHSLTRINACALMLGGKGLAPRFTNFASSLYLTLFAARNFLLGLSLSRASASTLFLDTGLEAVA